VCRTGFGWTATLADVEVESSTPVTIAGLPGIALVATGRRADRDGQVVVYQVLLSGGSGYVRMSGICPAERRAECLDMFEQTTATYRPRD